MSDALIPLDISDSPEILRLVEEMERSGVGRLLLRGSTEVAILTHVQLVGGDDAADVDDHDRDPERVLRIIGRGRSAHPGNIAEHKDEYIADAVGRVEP